jgi:predicted MFS family arabinose efflux permease
MRIHPYLDLLRRNPAFARLYAAELVSFGGDWFATVALLGLALQLTGSSAIASFVLVLQVGPFFLASPLAGVLADRLDRRRLMVTADVARAVIALGFLLARDPATLWIALLAAGGVSGLSAFFEPTSSAALPNLVDEADLPTANVLIGSAWGTMLAIGAAMGGIIAATMGRDAAFVLDAASFAISAWLIVGIRRSFGGASADTDTRATRVGFRSALVETWALARGSRRISALLLAKATFGVGSGAIFLLALFGSSVFGGGDIGIGILFAARGLGALIGPFLARAVVSLDDPGTFLGIGASFVVFVSAYLLLPLAPGIAVAAVLVFAGHLGGGAQWMLSSLGLQRAVPDAIRGRVFSVDYALVTLAVAVSTLLAGAVASAAGPTVALYALMIPAACAALAWLIWTRSMRRADRATLPE